MSGRDERARRRLREANPLKPEDAPEPTSAKGQAMFERIVRTPGAQPKRSPWRGRRALMILVPAVIVASAAGYSLLAKAKDPFVVACFDKPSLGSNRHLVSLRGDDLVAACQHLWNPGADFNPAGAEPPALVACVLDGGGLGVFPRLASADTCRALGLEPASGEEVEPEHRAIQAVQQELAPQFLGSCLGQDEATALVRASLLRHRLGRWQVVATGAFTEERPCATLAFDPPTRTVSLVPTSADRST